MLFVPGWQTLNFAKSYTLRSTSPRNKVSTGRNHSESSLINRLQTGDQEAFTAIYHDLHKRLYFFATRFVPEEDAEDIIAEAFIDLWKRRAEHQSIDELSAYLYVTVRNRCFNLIRNAKLHKHKHAEILHLLQSEAADNHLVEQVRVELIDLIFTHVERLPARMKEVFLLSYRDGLKPAEIADQLNISVQTVSNQKVAAIKQLRTVLAQHGLTGLLVLLIQLEQL